jgi:hypothetical protein
MFARLARVLSDDLSPRRPRLMFPVENGSPNISVLKVPPHGGDIAEARS